MDKIAFVVWMLLWPVANSLSDWLDWNRKRTKPNYEPPSLGCECFGGLFVLFMWAFIGTKLWYLP